MVGSNVPNKELPIPGIEPRPAMDFLAGFRSRRRHNTEGKDKAEKQESTHGNTGCGRMLASLAPTSTLQGR